MTSAIRRVLTVTNVKRVATTALRERVARGLNERGIEVIDVTDLNTDDDGIPTQPLDGVELVLVFGGDGTLLWAAQIARRVGVPLLGVNGGHMGFLAEAEETNVNSVIDAVARRLYSVERRMCIDVEIHCGEGVISDWAVNEAAVLRTDLAHPAQLGLSVDDHAVSSYGADGMIVATPTGSTAYSFSAGGPVVWPDTEAMLLVPLAAHGLFTRPLVVGPHSVVDVTILEDQWAPLELWMDGIRRYTVTGGDRIVCRRSTEAMPFARICDTPFSARLVAKFNLPVRGWKNEGRSS